jgi:hypothetical protein
VYVRKEDNSENGLLKKEEEKKTPHQKKKKKKKTADRSNCQKLVATGCWQKHEAAVYEMGIELRA